MVFLCIQASSTTRAIVGIDAARCPPSPTPGPARLESFRHVLVLHPELTHKPEDGGGRRPFDRVTE